MNDLRADVAVEDDCADCAGHLQPGAQRLAVVCVQRSAWGEAGDIRLAEGFERVLVEVGNRNPCRQLCMQSESAHCSLMQLLAVKLLKCMFLPEHSQDELLSWMQLSLLPTHPAHWS